jgi:two-component system, LuxR family, sensor kinase FixL
LTERTAIAASEALLHSILATVPDAMIVIDESGVIVSFSATAERLFGFGEVEAIGRNVTILMPESDKRQHDDYILRYLTSGKKRIIGVGRIMIGQRRDGSTFPMELSVGEARTAHSRVFTGFIRDLTRRQATEVRLEELQAELAHASRVSAMGTMASALAHELNQPLTAIANYVEATRDLLADPNTENVAIVRNALGDAATQAVRAGQIVRRLRDFIARGDTDKRVENLRGLINEANALALIGVVELGIDIRIDIDERIGGVLVDKVQIQQVMVNLIRNAIEALTGAPERRLTIAAKPVADRLVQVSVIDTGPGLDPDVESKLFQPFVSTKAAGMGLGLSICQTIIEAHNGTIWLDKLSGGGSAFCFTLAAADADDDR